MRRVWAVALKLIAAGVLVVVGVGLFFTWGLKEGQQVQVGDVDPDSLKDGVFHGSFKNGRWSNQLRVEIKNHTIKSIEVVDDMLAADEKVKGELFNRVIREQTTKVDVVTGATVTSKAYLKSIENALVTGNQDP